MEHQTRLSRDAAMVATPASSSGLPTDLLSQSASRLQVLAVMYIVVFLLAGVFPAFLVPADREMFLSSFMHWGPSMIGIIVGSIVALAIRYGTIKAQTAMTLGLVFEVASSYAIAAAEFGNPHQRSACRSGPCSSSSAWSFRICWSLAWLTSAPGWCISSAPR